jgi:hypothetical protein
MTPEEFLSLSASEMEAMHGVEDLHADGAFDDTQSPCLNRLFRQEAYQVMYAMQHADEGTGDEFVDYLVEVGQDGHRMVLAHSRRGERLFRWHVSRA